MGGKREPQPHAGTQLGVLAPVKTRPGPLHRRQSGAAIKVISRLGIERETRVIVAARREQPATLPHGIHAIVCREDILGLPTRLCGSDQRITHTTGHDPVRYSDIAVSIWSTRKSSPQP
jgi:hypothetical protein